MKTTIRRGALFATSLFLSGCATEPGDQKFFEENWMHPTKRDETFWGSSTESPTETRDQKPPEHSL